MADEAQNFDTTSEESGDSTPLPDSTSETASKETNGASNQTYDLKICSPSTRISSSNSSNPFTHNKFVRPGILKPPQLSLNNTNNSKPSVVLNPSRFNPFAGPASNDNSKDEKVNQVNGETPKFVPLIHTKPKTSAAQTPATTTNTALTSATFVFGQNLQDRVVSGDNKADDPKPSTSLNSNGTTDMLFSSAIKNDVKAEGVANREAKSLSESAREYEESRANKRKYEEVEIITGEEDETNILNINCKLFAFDKASGTWQERGRGILRLNDFNADGHVQSRLVFRTSGIWRVILNTKIWGDMTVEQASEKSVRFTAIDPQGVIKVFLVMASIEDSKQLYSLIQTRVQKEIAAQKHKKPNVHTDSGGN